MGNVDNSSGQVGMHDSTTSLGQRFYQVTIYQGPARLPGLVGLPECLERICGTIRLSPHTAR